MHDINKVLLVGQVADAGPKLSYTSEGTPECHLTLLLQETGKSGQVYKLFVPVEVYSAHGEWTAEHVNAGDVVLVDGKLKWKSTIDKQGAKQGRMVILAWQLSLITPTPALSTN
jgi:single-stranded DNA-binding protein